MSKAEYTRKLLEEYVKRSAAAGSERLPTERELCRELGVSRSTIGKALGMLEAEGIVERKVGAGTFIAGKKRESGFTVALLMRNAYHCTDSHFRLIAEKVSEYAEQHNIHVQIYDRLIDMFRENPDDNRLLKAIRSGVVDGLLVSSRMPFSILGRIHAFCPTVSINNIFGDGVEIPCVSCDYFRAGFMAGRHLLEKGHRKIAFLTETLEHPESAFDLSGFKSALESKGCALPPENILVTTLNQEISAAKITDFFERTDCTACFVRSCSLATRLVGILEKINLGVPGDISIIAAGNYQNGRQSPVRLTTLDNRLADMCELGLSLLRKKLAKPKSHNSSLTLLEPRLIERDSVIARDSVL